MSPKWKKTDEPYEATRKYLGQLQFEYADLMLIHRPPTTGAGEDLWRGLMRVKEDGLANDIGEALIDATHEVPTVNQIERSPFGYSEAMLRYAAENNIVIQAYSRLPRAKRLDDETLADIAAKHGKSTAQVLIRWRLQLGTAPIPKANRRAHLEENIDVFDFGTGDEGMAALDALNYRYSSLGMLPYE